MRFGAADKASETVADAINACKRSHFAGQVIQITHAFGATRNASAGRSAWRTKKKRMSRFLIWTRKKRPEILRTILGGGKRPTVKLLVSLRPHPRRTLLTLITRTMVPVEEGTQVGRRRRIRRGGNRWVRVTLVFSEWFFVVLSVLYLRPSTVCCCCCPILPT